MGHTGGREEREEGGGERQSPKAGEGEKGRGMDEKEQRGPEQWERVGATDVCHRRWGGETRFWGTAGVPTRTAQGKGRNWNGELSLSSTSARAGASPFLSVPSHGSFCGQAKILNLPDFGTRTGNDCHCLRAVCCPFSFTTTALPSGQSQPLPSPSDPFTTKEICAFSLRCRAASSAHLLPSTGKPVGSARFPFLVSASEWLLQISPLAVGSTCPWISPGALLGWRPFRNLEVASAMQLKGSPRPLPVIYQ